MFTILFIGMCFLLVGCSSADSTVAYTPQEINLEGDALLMQNKVNELRASQGVGALKGEAKLMELCEGKATQMYNDDTINHSDFQDRFEASGATCIGECLSYNYLTVSSEYLAWYDSKFHLNTLINGDYTHMAYFKKGKYGCLMVAGYGTGKNKGKKSIEVITYYKGGIVNSLELSN